MMVVLLSSALFVAKQMVSVNFFFLKKEVFYCMLYS